MADETLFGWVHLSDIHFGHGDAGHHWDQELVLERLRDDVPRVVALGAAKPDAILVTGDIAFSGAGVRADEYDRARAWLLEVGAQVGLDHQQIFVVPGNHDVNRKVDATDALSQLTVEKWRDGAASIDVALANPQTRAALAARIQNYLAFAAGFAPACFEPEASAKSLLFWTHTLSARGGLRVRLAGLNTSLLAKDRDQGKLQLGKEQLGGLKRGAAPGEVIVALSHHPFAEGWLRDEKDADRWLQSVAHVHLSGHVHDADMQQVRRGSGTEMIRVGAGAAHNEAMPESWIPQSHGYSIAEIVRAEGGRLKLRLWPRRWSDKNKDFRTDVDFIARGGDFTELDLRATLPEAAPSPVPEPVKVTPAVTPAPPAVTSAQVPAAPPVARLGAGPVRVFCSCAKEDLGALDELLVAASGMTRRQKVMEVSSSRDDDPLAKLAQANLIVIMMSPHYLASDYCYEVELEAARKQREAGAARVLVLLVREADLGSYQKDYARIASNERTLEWFEQGAPMPRYSGRDTNKKGIGIGEPVSKWKDRDAAWTEVVEELRDEIARMRSGK